MRPVAPQIYIYIYIYTESKATLCAGRGGRGRVRLEKRPMSMPRIAQSIDEFEVLKGVGGTKGGGWGGGGRVTGQPSNVAITHGQGLQRAHTHTHTLAPDIVYTSRHYICLGFT